MNLLKQLFIVTLLGMRTISDRLGASLVVVVGMKATKDARAFLDASADSLALPPKTAVLAVPPAYAVWPARLAPYAR